MTHGVAPEWLCQASGGLVAGGERWLAGLGPPKLRLVSRHGNRRAPSVLAGLTSIVHDGENAAGANQHNHRCNNKDEAALHLRPRNCVSQTPTPYRFSEISRERAMNAPPGSGYRRAATSSGREPIRSTARAEVPPQRQREAAVDHCDGRRYIKTASHNAPTNTPKRKTAAKISSTVRRLCGGGNCQRPSSILYSAKKRASVCSHSPIMLARCARSSGQLFGKQ
jgi:hypothetical protein